MQKKSKNARKSTKKPRSYLKSLTRNTLFLPMVVMAIVLITLAVIGILQFTADKNSNDATTKLAAPKNDHYFKSEEHRFKADFPGDPKVHTASFNFDEYTWPMTFYVYTVEGEKKLYMVYVINLGAEFQNLSKEKMRAVLENAVNNTARSSGGEVVSSEFSENEEGQQALDAVIELKPESEGQTISYYTFVFNANDNLYQIAVAGEPLEVYNSFVNSFEFF